ncbi:Zn-ribbon domain-containing OB-fold protein [Pseudooceanicola sp.]|uniref:Zn-ribbon domain-containing OB-fold protein n=1 Tax=Pseudooceanicola sp. TaxID=1914328 RepID=UPI0035C75A38
MSGIAADRSGAAAAYWAAMDDRRLMFQRCRACGSAQLPPREECTSCLSPDLAWEEASGDARLVSWVVYHRAYHEGLADDVPYVVAVVELAEGVRLISNIPGDGAGLRIDMPLRLVWGERFGQVLPWFEGG